MLASTLAGVLRICQGKEEAVAEGGDDNRDRQGRGQVRARARESTGMKQDERFREDDRSAASLRVVTQLEITWKKRGNEAAIAFCIL